MQREMMPFVEQIPVMMVPKRHLMRYKKDRRGRRQGVVIAVKDDNDKVYIGWSLYKRREEEKKGVRFEREMGIAHALRHAQELGYLEEDMTDVAHSMRTVVKEMIERARRYFKLDEPTSLLDKEIKKLGLSNPAEEKHVKDLLRKYINENKS